MAELLGKAVRGRKKGALRVAITALAVTFGKTKAGSQTVVLIEKDGKTAADTVTIDTPKGAVIAPFSLTRGKSGANVGEQIRSGMADAEVDGFKVESYPVRLNDGTEGESLFLIVPA